MHFTEYDTRLAAYGLLTSKDGLILLTWFNGGTGGEPGWTMPGGGVEFGESIAAAVSREVLEETGYQVVAGRVLAEHHFTVARTHTHRPFRSQRFILEATITGGKLGTVETDGTTDFARWVPIAKVPSLAQRKDIVDIAMGLLTDHSE